MLCVPSIQTREKGAPKPAVYLWGGGSPVPTKLTVPLALTDSPIVGVDCGRGQRAGVTKDGKLIFWEVWTLLWYIFDSISLILFSWCLVRWWPLDSQWLKVRPHGLVVGVVQLCLSHTSLVGLRRLLLRGWYVETCSQLALQVSTTCAKLYNLTFDYVYLAILTYYKFEG